MQKRSQNAKRNNAGEHSKRQRDLRSFFPTQKSIVAAAEDEICTAKRLKQPATDDIEMLSSSQQQQPTISREQALLILRKFDLQSEFGPCVGLSRLERWQRAQRLGKHPPCEVHEILMEPCYASQPDIQQHLWHQESFCTFR
jgi:DNA polymerase delta subunit 4